MIFRQLNSKIVDQLKQHPVCKTFISNFIKVQKKFYNSKTFSIMKWFILVIIIFLSSIEAAKQKNTTPSPFGSFSLKVFKCKVSTRGTEEFIYPNYTCYAKSYSRTLSTWNFYLLFRKPLSYGFVRMKRILMI